MFGSCVLNLVMPANGYLDFIFAQAFRNNRGKYAYFGNYAVALRNFRSLFFKILHSVCLLMGHTVNNPKH
jgi:hypothetical protein